MHDKCQEAVIAMKTHCQEMQAATPERRSQLAQSLAAEQVVNYWPVLRAPVPADKATTAPADDAQSAQ
jgi:hypothetical protein